MVAIIQTECLGGGCINKVAMDNVIYISNHGFSVCNSCVERLARFHQLILKDEIKIKLLK